MWRERWKRRLPTPCSRPPADIGSWKPGAFLVFHFSQSCGFALEPAQIKQLCAADAAGANALDLVDHFRIQRENTFYALAEANFADGDAGLRSAFVGDYDAFKGLKTLFVAFFDSYLHSDGVPRIKAGKVLAL